MQVGRARHVDWKKPHKQKKTLLLRLNEWKHVSENPVSEDACKFESLYNISLKNP
jgi:uncharacterized protein YydD (DUF2326 family)